MKNQQIVKFDMYEMEYSGDKVTASLSLTPFEEKYYEQYKSIINDCFYEMRSVLNIKPYEKHSYALEEPAKLKENTFLLLDGDEIISAVTCSDEIGNVVVNLKYQGQGYGKKIMECAIALMQERTGSPIKLTVTKWNKKAIALYKSLGFKITQETTVEGVNTKDVNGNWSFEFMDTGNLNVR